MYTLEIARFKTGCTRFVKHFNSLEAVNVQYENAVFALDFEGVRAKIRLKYNGKIIKSAYLKGV